MTKRKSNKFDSKTINNIFDNVNNNIKKDNQRPRKNKKSNKKHKINKSNQNIKQNNYNESNSANKHTMKSKQRTITNKYGVLPMSCTLDIGTIGKLDSLKQVLGLHNRNEVVNLLLKNKKSLLKSNNAKSDYKLYFKVFMMKHKKQAEKHYKQFYKNSKK